MGDEGEDGGGMLSLNAVTVKQAVYFRRAHSFCATFFGMVSITGGQLMAVRFVEGCSLSGPVHSPLFFFLEGAELS